MISSPVAVPQSRTAFISPSSSTVSPIPLDVLPDPKKKDRLRLSVVSAGYTVSILGNIALLLSPLINKKAGPVTKVLTKAIGPEGKLHLLSGKRIQQLQETLPSKDKLVKVLWSVLGVGFLLQLPMEYKTSLNCKQPSMLICNAVTTLSTSCMLFSSNVAFRVMTILGDVFHRAGKSNDIENSNHLSQRREFELRALFSGNTQRNLPQEGQQLGRFLQTDLKQVFSFRPWKNLIATARHKETWTQPNANLSALAGQMSLIAGVNSLLSTVQRFPAPLRNTFRGITAASIVLHDASFQAPIFTRAWKNRDELEGKLVLGSVPFYMLGSPFFLSTKYLFMNSFTGLANPFWAKGINLNSEHRLETINYLKKIYAQSQQQPNLSAATVLEQVARPEVQTALQKRLGHSGLRFVMQTLSMAAEQGKQSKLSLAQFLYPLTLSNA